MPEGICESSCKPTPQNTWHCLAAASRNSGRREISKINEKKLLASRRLFARIARMGVWGITMAGIAQPSALGRTRSELLPQTGQHSGGILNGNKSPHMAINRCIPTEWGDAHHFGLHLSRPTAARLGRRDRRRRARTALFVGGPAPALRNVL